MERRISYTLLIQILRSIFYYHSIISVLETELLTSPNPSKPLLPLRG